MSASRSLFQALQDSLQHRRLYQRCAYRDLSSCFAPSGCQFKFLSPKRARPRRERFAPNIYHLSSAHNTGPRRKGGSHVSVWKWCRVNCTFSLGERRSTWTYLFLRSLCKQCFLMLQQWTVPWRYHIQCTAMYPLLVLMKSCCWNRSSSAKERRIR